MDAKTALQISLAVLFLASCAAAYFSAKTWQISHVVLIFFIFLFSGVYWYLSAAALTAHKKYREEARRLTNDLQQTKAASVAMLEGTKDEKILAALRAEDIALGQGSIREVEHKLRKLLVDRGRVWLGIQPQLAAAEGTSSVTIANPAPHRIERDMVLFVFEQGSVDEGARYVGEFRVTESADKSVTLQPTMKFSSEQLERLAAGIARQRQWVLYELMPADRHDLFAGLDEQQLVALIGQSTLQEYYRDGREASPDDPPERVRGYKKDGNVAGQGEESQIVERRYIRQLRDYELEFQTLHADQVLLADAVAQVQTDTARLNEALVKTERDIAERQQEQLRLTQDLEKFRHEVEVLKKYQETLQTQLSNLKAHLSKVFEGNRELAARLAKAHLDAAREINRRTSGQQALQHAAQ